MEDCATSFLRLQLVGNSRLFQAAVQAVRKIGPTDAPVLISGETGTGKELFARALHYHGPRADHPFVPVNCGALPEGLVESELFGHVRGAFTDAKQGQLGLVRLAEGGTLFLDEVDSLSPKAQVTLLRFLQDGEYRPVGSRALSKANVRILSASNARLPEAAAAGRFRADLLFRLAVVSIPLPALRDRPGDISLLVHHFMHQCAKTYGGMAKTLSTETLAQLEGYAWPGNVRELQNFVHGAYVLSEGTTLVAPPNAIAGPCLNDRSHEGGDEEGEGVGVGESSQALPFEAGLRAAKVAAIARVERNYLRWLLHQTRGNVSEAARVAHQDRRVLGRLIKKHGIDRLSYSSR